MSAIGSDLDVAIVQLAKEAQNPHVLSAAGVGHDLEAFLLHGDLVDLKAEALEVGHRPGVILPHLLIIVGGPHAFQQDLGPFLVGTLFDPGIRGDLVKGHDNVRLVAGIADHS